MVNIFEFTNYRLYLKEMYSHLKECQPAFSYRYFSKKCGFSSPNFLKLVIDGKRNISEESIQVFSSFFKHKKNEEKYFKQLVLFNQAKTSTEKKHLAKEILQSSLFKRLHPLSQDQFAYYSNWYFVAIREILSTKKIKLDAKTISQSLQPKVSEAKVTEALESLLRLGLIIRKNNRYVQVDELVTTGDEVSSAAIATHHREMFKLASESIDQVQRDFRDISGVTIAISDENIHELKLLIQRFRKNVLELSEQDENKQNVYQVSVQMFPLTEIKEESC